MNAQQEKMKTRNKEANAKKLKGPDRRAFIKTCLSGNKQRYGPTSGLSVRV
jgi:hypothetical protein